MLDAIAQRLATNGLLPHGYCLSWSPPLLWTFVVSDLLTFSAYASMPVAIVYFGRRRRDFPYRWLLWMFAAFILACGATHLMDAVVLWQPAYGTLAATKVLTALVSVAAAAALWRMVAPALALPSPAEIQRANTALQQEIRERKRVERALRLLTDCNKLLAQTNDERQLLGETCQHIVTTGGYTCAWVGFAEHDARKSVRPVAHAGGDQVFLDSLGISWADTPHGQGPTGTAIRTRSPQLIRSVRDDPRMHPWREATLARGHRSVLALPLVGETRVLGALGICASEPDAFPDEAQKLLEELANNLAFGIETLRVRAMNAAAEQQLDAYRNGLEALVAERTAELAAAKLDAERANNAKSRFLAAASHDLRQPLSALSLYVDVLSRSAPASGGQVIDHIRDCVGSLGEMLDDMLDLSKLHAGVVSPNVGDFSLETMLNKVVASHAPLAQEKGLSLSCRVPHLIGRTDPTLFQRIVGNLVSNAVRYTEKGGVLVGCRHRHGKWWVEVWDTGIGIPTDKIVEIFEEFKQLGNPARNRSMGTGLGLAIVARAADLLGLEVRVHSREGRGSVFAVSFPPGAAVPAVARERYLHRPLRIALVDDNAEVAGAVDYALSQVGHQVVSAASRAELMLRLGDVAPDFVISDYRLEDGEDGFDVIGAVRAAFGDALPAVIITGDTDPAVMRRMDRMGILVQHKPVDLETLRARIAKLTA